MKFELSDQFVRAAKFRYKTQIAEDAVQQAIQDLSHAWMMEMLKDLGGKFPEMADREAS